MKKAQEVGNMWFLSELKRREGEYLDAERMSAVLIVQTLNKFLGL